MIIKHVLSFILCLFVFLTLFQGWFGFKSNDNVSSFISNNKHRKILATTTGFDFTPFLNRQGHHHRHHHHHRSHHLPKDQTEVDPRYGVDKRLVPSGPNPLHH
uniref:Uncharacterized protein n=1 Tax=Lotus japonicus TaxID=34305 RepID=I3T3H1_LOTJA|nr:unknown [Lotus japonicus]